MKAKWIGNWFIGSGLLLIAAALCLTVYNLCEEARAASTAADALQKIRAVSKTEPTEAQQPDQAESMLSIPAHIRDPHMEMPTEEINGQSYVGVLDIPALELSLPVISQWSYPGLKIAPCRYRGSAYLDDLIIAAHNYQSHFGTLLNLKLGDNVYFTDMDGNVFVYTVCEIETLDAAAVESMMSGDWALTLFTCTVGGQTRVTVRCSRSE